ncbi:arginine--tRNA ligase [Sphaerobacter thermophilus]|uniref:Arginine--tRNA ligase n=1 Tax=Sphaerobacter thermophilus (strain ATCC 49802 / DSM 20745 / KCCM 41009 / NCIMB 13125 / S 6022) TaxID=479434 RepID=D1C767_SPHTD|nr:arginine--tRNA ligase [Sphaerobacter thermophilus]ACZ39713.1 arginyl-tRNA synthetase [Sphaerobacter thermophilus DSM 20745]PZN65566.1 MAG: arginine--tRNA ligase [Sphaerobacter thermophilus]
MVTTFQTEERRAAALINDALEELGYGRREFDMRAIPFAGVWGTSASVSYQIATELVTAEAAAELEGLSKKEAKRRTQELVRQRAQAIAEQVAERLRAADGFASVEAVNGYINIGFDTNRFSNEVVHAVLTTGEDYGRGEPKTDRVMVEYSQPNTHKAFHVGHLRNVCLGNALSRIMKFAGFDVLQANYIGDIGLHVIKTLWCYQRFHQGEEPPRAQRGRWLGEIYTEADQRLNYRQDVVDLLNDLARNDATFREAVDRMMKELWREHKVGEDVAYLLGQIANAREIKTDAFYDDETIKKFWPIVGKQLTTSLEAVRENPPQPAAEGEPQPFTAADYEERLERWRRLGEHLDWWPHVPEWQREVRQTFQLWEKKDPAFVQLWEETKAWSMEEFHRIYDQLDVHFDVWFYESEVEEPGRQIVQELLERGIAEISDGLPVVKIDEKLGLEKETYRTLPILRSDGTTLYSTKDLALTKMKFEQYHVDRSIWVVDVRQSLYFQQIFKIMELWGFEQAEKCYHLSYETVMLPTGAMSSRSGNVVLYEDIAARVLQRAREIIDEKNPSLPDEVKDRIANDVGLGSMKYGMLMRDNNRVLVFDIEEALSFEGHAAPYIQYAHARACRILEKVDQIPTEGLTFTDLTTEEINLIQQVAIFPSEVERAAAEYKPLVIANYVYELAKRFNDFYRACPVLQAEEPQRSARLALVAAARQTLANGLGLLGIAAPETM